MSQNDTHEENPIIETQALVVRPEGGAVGILRPAGSLDAIADAFKEYQAVCERILTKDDYQLYEGKPRKKKSAWRKLATAFNVSTEKVSEDIQRQDKKVISARYTMRAFTPSRRMEAEGYCEVTEKCCASARGEKCHKAAWKTHYCCVNGCDGRKHWSHPEHDIISTAQTRATNRAIADLIGCGEVSAEELVDDRLEGPRSRPAPIAQRPTPSKEPPKPNLPAPTAKTRLWMVKELSDCADLAREYFQKIDQLLPTEGLSDLPLRFVPNSKEQMAMLRTRVAQFGNGDRAEPAFPPHWDTEDFSAKPAAESLPKPDDPNPEAWRSAVVHIPRKGMKLADYIEKPDTLGSLWDLRHGNDDESAYARQRLFGLVEHHSEPTGWTKKDGSKMPPTQDDFELAKWLKEFKVWFEANHRGERL